MRIAPAAMSQTTQLFAGSVASPTVAADVVRPYGRLLPSACGQFAHYLALTSASSVFHGVTFAVSLTRLFQRGCPSADTQKRSM